MTSIRKSILKLYTVIFCVGFAYFIWGKLTGLYIPCLYYKTTGLLCPGCGISRMFLAMARLDFVGAFFHNPVMFTAFFYWNTVALLCFIGKPGFVSKKHFLYGSLYAWVGVFLIFALLRNIFR